jgi:dTDP-N-acetylfucosamine:lipid II N-acetylfucosaminyltransferase
MKIIHLLVDDKFIDSAIREFETVSPGVHEYLLPSGQPPFRYLRSELVQAVSREACLARLRQTDVAAVVCHGLPLSHLLMLPELPPGPTVIWLGWGYDYYGLIADAFPQGLFMPETSALVARIHPRGGLPQPGVMRSSVLSAARPYAKPSRTELAALQRIDLFSPVLPNEYHLVKQHQRSFKADFIRWNYGTTEDDMRLIGAGQGLPRLGSNILVGNSATPANNHLECFAALRKLPDLEDRQVVVPLSYGDFDGAYTRHIVSVGTQHFGSRFTPLLEFLPKDRYIEVLTSCGHVMMNHIRQQAMGNLIISGLMGAKLHMNRSNPAASWLKRLGLPISDLARPDLSALSPADALTQAQALQTEYGRATQRPRTRQLVDVALTPRP